MSETKEKQACKTVYAALPTDSPLKQGCPHQENDINRKIKSSDKQTARKSQWDPAALYF